MSSLPSSSLEGSMPIPGLWQLHLGGDTEMAGRSQGGQGTSLVRKIVDRALLELHQCVRQLLCTNSAQGIESLWRYLKRDTCCGSNGAMSLTESIYSLPADIHEDPQWQARVEASSSFTSISFLEECGHDISFRANHNHRNVENSAEPGRADPSAFLHQCNPTLRRAFGNVARPLYLKRSECGRKMGTICPPSFRRPTSRASWSPPRTASAPSRRRDPLHSPTSKRSSDLCCCNTRCSPTRPWMSDSDSSDFSSDDPRLAKRSKVAVQARLCKLQLDVDASSQLVLTCPPPHT